MLPSAAAIVRYARQKLRYAAGTDMSQVTHGYFVSHSPRIWRPMAIDMNHVTDPEDGLRLPVAYVSGSVHSIRPRYRPGGASGDHSGENHQIATHFVPEGADMNDALFEQSHHADDETDIHEDEAKRYVAGQRAVRQFVGLDPEKAPYHAAILTSKELADEAARATGGFVHEVQLNPRQFEANHIPVLNARDGSAILIKSPGLAGPLNNSETQEDISRQVHLAKFSGTRDEALRHLHQLNQRYWPLLTQHADALQTIPGSVHPHTALLGSHLRDHQHLLAPSHEELLQAGEPVSTIYQMALRHPEEPVHRMALADTLDDHGHGDAAEFFRSTLPGSEAPAKPQKLSRHRQIVSYARGCLSSSSSPSLRSLVVGYAAQKLKYAASGEPWIPAAGERVRLRIPKGQPAPAAFYTYDRPIRYTNGRHIVNLHDADGKWIGRLPVAGSDILHAAHDVTPGATIAKLMRPVGAQKLKYAAAQPKEPLPHEHPDPHAQAGASRLEQTDWADDSGSTVLDPVRKHMANIMGRPVSDADMADILRIPRPYKNAPDHPALHASNFIVDFSPSHPFDKEQKLTVHVKSKLPGYAFHTETRISRGQGGPQIVNHSQGHDGIEGERKAISTPHILWNQAFAAHRNGVKFLLTNAELRRSRVNGLGGSTGGLVWPKYGYDAHLKHISPWRAFEHVPEDLRVAMANRWPKKPFNSLTLQDLLDTPEGHNWYFKQEDRMQTLPKYVGGGTFPGVHNPNAFEGEMFFHTHPGKRSMQKALGAARNIELKNGGASNANA